MFNCFMTKTVDELIDIYWYQQVGIPTETRMILLPHNNS